MRRIPKDGAKMIDWALYYASMGWAVFPIQPGTKRNLRTRRAGTSTAGNTRPAPTRSASASSGRSTRTLRSVARPDRAPAGFTSWISTEPRARPEPRTAGSTLSAGKRNKAGRPTPRRQSPRPDPEAISYFIIATRSSTQYTRPSSRATAWTLEAMAVL